MGEGRYVPLKNSSLMQTSPLSSMRECKWWSHVRLIYLFQVWMSVAFECAGIETETETGYAGDSKFMVSHIRFNVLWGSGLEWVCFIIFIILYVAKGAEILIFFKCSYTSKSSVWEQVYYMSKKKMTICELW